jgi:hypothetical protein
MQPDDTDEVPLRVPELTNSRARARKVVNEVKSMSIIYDTEPPPPLAIFGR